MTKALIHDLGKSLSFGRLSLLAKVLWPMIIASSDDQGRGLAEADAVKWYVCPNVPEITKDNLPDLLGEMVTQEMILLYQDGRGRWIYQIARWWEYQKLQWARPSKYDAPEGWIDRLRYREGGEYHEENWKDDGQSLCDSPETSPERPPEPLPEASNQPKLNQTKPTDSANAGAETAPPDPPPEQKPPDEPPKPQTLDEWLSLVRENANKQAVLRRMVTALYPTRDPPGYSYIAKTAKGVGGYERLAHLLWLSVAYRVTGDPLAYCKAMHKGGDNGRNTGRSRGAGSGQGAAGDNTPTAEEIEADRAAYAEHLKRRAAKAGA